MLTNQQRAHDLAMLQLQLNIPLIQKRFSQKTINKADSNLVDMYIETYKNALVELDAKLIDGDQ